MRYFVIVDRRIYMSNGERLLKNRLPESGDLIQITRRTGEPVNLVVGEDGVINVESIDTQDILTLPNENGREVVLQVRPYSSGLGVLVNLGLATAPTSTACCPGKTAIPGWYTTGDIEF